MSRVGVRSARFVLYSSIFIAPLTCSFAFTSLSLYIISSLLNCICLLVLIHHRAGPNTGTRQATECVTRLRVGTQRDPRKARRSEERSIGALNLNRTFRPLECTVIVLSLLISSVFSAVLCSSECPPPRRPAPLIAATRVVSCDRVTSWRGVRCDSDHFWVDSLSRLPLPLLCSAGASSVNKNEVK